MSQCRPAAHAGIERAGKMNIWIERVLQVTIVSAFNDRQAEIARMTESVDSRSLLHRLGLQREETLGPIIRPHHGKIVSDIDAQNLSRNGQALCAGHLDAV